MARRPLLLLLAATLACARPDRSPEPVQPARADPVIRGSVRVDDRPLAGARISVAPAASREWGLVELAADGRASSTGEFALDALAPGDYVVCASGPDATIWSDPQAVEAGSALRLALEAKPGHALHGRVREPSSDTELFVGRITPVSLRYDICLLELETDGSFKTRLPPDFYWLGARSPGRASKLLYLDLRSEDAEVELDLAPRIVGEPPNVNELLAQLRPRVAHLDPSASGEPDELAPLVTATAGARVVGFGEATHGTREFFTLKHRAIIHLIEHEGFDLVLFEVSLSAGESLDAYVQGGPGDVLEILEHQGRVWPWLNDEVVAFFADLRAHNLARTAGQPAVHVIGIDNSTPDRELAAVQSYLEAADPKFAAAIVPRLGLPEGPEALADSLTALAELGEQLDRDRSRYEGNLGADAWSRARQRVRMIEAALTDEAPNDRDLAMAATALWALEQAGPDSRATLWAHNMHVHRGEFFGLRMLGGALAEALADEYVAVGFGFDHGRFAAYDLTHGYEGSPGVVAHEVGPAPAGSFGAILAKLGGPALFIDLRRLRDPTVEAWVRTRQLVRWTGAEFNSEAELEHLDVPAEAFDALLFVLETNASTLRLPSK